MTKADGVASTGLRDDARALAQLLSLLGPLDPPEHGPGRSYGVVPSLGRPRYLLPVDAWPVSDKLIFRVGAPDSKQQQAATRLLGPALRTGLFRALRRQVTIPDGTDDDPSLLVWLQQELDRDDLLMGVAMGPPRPNRKPILQVLSTSGEAVCFGKLGADPLTDALVKREADFLESYQPFDLGAPAVIGTADWHGHELMLLTPLPVSHGGGKSTLTFTARDIRNIAKRLPIRHQDVDQSEWWLSMDNRRRAVSSARTILTNAAVEAVGTRLAGVRWEFGAWHGDLTPWNAERIQQALYVWDWERAGGPVPLGFDGAHAAFQVASLQLGLSIADAVAAAATSVDPLLTELRVPANEHRLLLDCYLLELCFRMMEAEQSGGLGRLGDTVDALLALIAAGH